MVTVAVRIVVFLYNDIFKLLIVKAMVNPSDLLLTAAEDERLRVF